MKTVNTHKISLNLPIIGTPILALLLVFSLNGCSSGGSSDEDPDGFYEGSATVDRPINDLQGMVSGNRFMLVSDSEVLVYDGTFTDIDKKSFTATVNVYENGELIVGAGGTASGTIIEGSSITGTFTGTGTGDGTFSLTYSLHNTASVASRIEAEWTGTINGVSEPLLLDISNIGEMSLAGGDYSTTTPVVAGCILSPTSTALPISNVNVYALTITLSTCTTPAVNGSYTGFATTTTVNNDVLILAYSNGSFSASGILPVF